MNSLRESSTEIEMYLFTVCMAVYRNDKPDYFLTALHSIYKQTVCPTEIILVVDGPVPTILNESINTLIAEIPILKIIRLKENKGHAFARQTGLDAATNNLVAMMDSDDISVYERFEKQLKAFEEHPDVSVVGGIINEFIRNPENIVGKRQVPEYDDHIKSYMKSRCPMNMTTVMLRKDNIMKVGGFQDWYCEEDYYLWIRLALSGYKFYNIQENLVNVRVGDKMYQRRGGIRYFKSEIRLQKYMWKNKIINFPKFIYNILLRLIFQILMPNKLRGWAFHNFARS